MVLVGTFVMRTTTRPLLSKAKKKFESFRLSFNRLNLC